jgi:signal transduction histidine kinase
MCPFAKTLILCLLPALGLAAVTPPDLDANDQKKYNLTQLENRLTEIDAELSHLARFTLRTGVGNIGWISNTKKNQAYPEWAQIELPGNKQIDRIVLVPVIWNDAEKGPQADGFPEAFKIIAGTTEEPEGRVIARFDAEDHFLPRIAPLVIDVPPTMAAWVRVQSTCLSRHARNNSYRFKMSEIMLFSGDQNIGLNRPVSVSSNTGISSWGNGAIYKESLVDGLTPFLMDAAQGKKSDPYMAFSQSQTPYSFVIDLGSSRPIDGIRFHSADVQEYVPQINPSDFGIPKILTIEGANRTDFSDAVCLLDHQRNSVYEAGNIIEWPIPKTDCRYVRLSVPADGWPLDTEQQNYCISWAEIEILSNGKNVEQRKRPLFPKNIPFTNRRPESLTDRRNHFGAILPTREWIEQMARRHDLETEKPLVSAELNRRYTRQKNNLQLMYWLAALLTAGIAFTALINRMIRLRSVLKLRERIAANLHDELAANLHAIVLLSDMAKNNIDTRNKLEDILERINHLSKRSRSSARYCTNMLQADSICEDLVEEMKHSANRLLADIRNEGIFEGESILRQIPKRKRIDLFLFYKECLTNIARHASATSCTTQLTGTPKRTRLIVTDNGLGITKVPPSLQRRARLLGARIQIETPETGGTRIILTLKTRRRREPGNLQPNA